MTVSELITKLEKFPEDVANEAERVMKQEVPVRTGALRDSIAAEKTGPDSYFIGTGIDHAKYVEHGRGPVVPKKARVLHWFDGKDIFAKHASAVPANDFVGRTARSVRAYIRSYGLGG